MKFEPSQIFTGEKTSGDLAFIYWGSSIYLKDGGIPAAGDLEDAGFFGDIGDDGIDTAVGGMLRSGCFFGSLGGRACFAYHTDSEDVPIGFEAVPLRSCLSGFDEALWRACCYSVHLAGWHDRSRFCGRCGAPLNPSGTELSKSCSGCGNVIFPKISPAIIIAVMKDEKILLAHNSNFSEGRYSLLAGFMEIGETIEETAKREVKEEAGIEIENIRYLASQSWPFPDSLMIGLTAEYKSGELVPDGEEILDAGWFTPENFPLIPGEGTIARKIIDRCTKKNRS